MPVFDPLVAEYRYFVADLLSNEVIAELPLKGVSYERAIKSAGNFSADMPIIDSTSAYNMYEFTMPGKTALYVVRNNECVWGGIIWSRSYSAADRQLSISGSEFTSYFYHRNIWKTYSHQFEASIVASGGTAAVTLTNATYPFVAGMPLRIDFLGSLSDYNDARTVLASPIPTSTTFSATITGLPNGTYTGVTVTVRIDSYDYVRRLIDTVLSDFADISFPNDEIEPGIQRRFNVTNKALTSNVATLTTSIAHDVIVGQVVDIENVDSTFNGSYEVSGVTSNTVSYQKTATNVPSTAVLSVSRTVTAREFNAVSGIATLTTSVAHGFVAGNIVDVAGVDDVLLGASVFNGKFTITGVPTSNTFTYSSYHVSNVAPSSTSGTAIVSPLLWSNTFGPFSGNSNFGLDYSTSDYSGVNLSNVISRGFELKSVGEELDTYSDSIDGFEYRIDCSYDTATSSFKRTFILIPINFPDPPPAGEASPIERFGAQNLIFEFPGNISTVSIDESAEDAATRFFVVGSDSTLGGDASQPYAVASAKDLLDGGWPLLDGETSKNDLFDEQALYDYASRYISEFRPPVSDIKVSVNGSLAPQVGTYSPGDWCCLIIDDYFIQQRLLSRLEPRSDLLVRKIESFKVSVPDNPSFPEQVELGLITEWEVDKIGE
jgi:hypothetical protein